MNEQVLQRIQSMYGIENWSAGYFDVNDQGNMIARPSNQDDRWVDLKKVLDHLVHEQKLQLPILLRFPQILSNQLEILTSAYKDAIQQFDYRGKHFPVFPMKVNPRREVVEEFLRDSGRLRVGLECGSKAELYAGIAQEQMPETLLICNGFKDESFCRLACVGVQAGKRVVIVIEKLNELKMLLRVAAETGVCPSIGLRVKLYTRGSGKWASSGGDSAKFGLTTSEIMECVKLLKESGREGHFKLLHFHIGSQITDIKRVKNAMKEAARVYAKIHQLGLDIEYLDIGGGLGVDYDGSKTRFESSMNYTVQEFANDVVYTIQAVCDEEEVPHPNLVTESGRMMTAYHTILVVSIREEIETFADDQPEVEIDEDDPQVITELKWLCDDINGKNYLEYYHDAIEHKDELHTQFNLGLISLEDRAKGEVLYWEVCARALKESEQARVPHEEFEEVKRVLAAKYLCNFSLFRSAPDSWAIGQLFPIVPIHRLHESRLDFATLVDVTCDSDGKIDKFVDLKDVKETLELPEWKENEDYYLGLFLVGAYQEVMGSYHNLFGVPNEAQVIMDGADQFRIAKIVPGSRISDMVSFAHYDAQTLQSQLAAKIQERVEAGCLDPATGEALLEQYRAAASWNTYLD
ncbi:Biosynthetic arginine decarboxylase [Pirellula sp. SH-Sr6A]|uniref:biosynthetic arginine decarboxylase n=1 Tax=Pirellula sp. SH-Sr6A TaxID=1632865 RepID=UPI00078EEB73|nr:biosynthetic arginine decarboxylase [Pirellula sp. SH-Sr6A]AMV34044.1 Biosynthetic arginine decarboxylase [Pirellula sp. SH-Sr6A]